MTTGDNITGTLGEYYRQKIVTAIVGRAADCRGKDWQENRRYPQVSGSNPEAG